MTLKQAHYESCKAEGKADEEIARDWEQFEKDFEEWAEEVAATVPEPEETGDAECAVAAREIGLMQAHAETCEDRQYGCPSCPFRK